MKKKKIVKRTKQKLDREEDRPKMTLKVKETKIERRRDLKGN